MLIEEIIEAGPGCVAHIYEMHDFSFSFNVGSDEMIFRRIHSQPPDIRAKIDWLHLGNWPKEANIGCPVAYGRLIRFEPASAPLCADRNQSLAAGNRLR